MYMLAKRSKSNMPKWYEEKLKNGCPNKTYRETCAGKVLIKVPMEQYINPPSFEQIDIYKHSSREYMKHRNFLFKESYLEDKKKQCDSKNIAQTFQLD